MRRYTLDISDREFVIDVQEVSADRFEVFVGGESYEVALSSDENLAEAIITPGLQAGSGAAPRAATNTAARVRQAPSATQTVAAPSAPRKPATGGGKGALTAPMPGVILEISVNVGDQVTRGQQVVVLDAMKMHNVIGAPRAGTIAEVHVTAGQTVDHGDAIVRFKED